MPIQVACSPFKLIRNVRKKTFEITLLYVKKHYDWHMILDG